jgi:hypothetical protein
VAEAADIASQRGQRCARSYLPAILTAGLAAGQMTILEIPDWKGERLPGVIVAWDTKSLKVMFKNAALAVFMPLRAASQGDSGPGVVYVRHRTH